MNETTKKINSVCEALLTEKCNLLNITADLCDLKDFTTQRLIIDAIKKIDEAISIYIAK